MIIRTGLAVAIIAVGITAVVADIISDRKDLMKRSGAQAKAGAALVAGREPFDLAKAKGVFELYIDKANKLPVLFAERPKAGEKTDAAPAIWDKAAEFKAQGEKFGRESKAALDATKDLESFKAQFAIVQQNCAGCHETFRIKS